MPEIENALGDKIELSDLLSNLFNDDVVFNSISLDELDFFLGNLAIGESPAHIRELARRESERQSRIYSKEMAQLAAEQANYTTPAGHSNNILWKCSEH